MDGWMEHKFFVRRGKQGCLLVIEIKDGEGRRRKRGKERKDKNMWS